MKITGVQKYSHTGEPLLQAFHAALTMDDLHHRHDPHRMDRLKFSRNRRLRKVYYNFYILTHILQESAIHLFAPAPFNQYDPVLLNAVTGHYVSEALSICITRVPVRISQHAYLGIFTESVREDDTVVLLKGSRVPSVIRQSTKGPQSGFEGKILWTITGGGYLHDIMSGEAWDEEKCETLTFV